MKQRGDTMIIRQTVRDIECIKQHDHAYISGEVAKHWLEPVQSEVYVAVLEHDRAWIPLDQIIKYDADRGLPHDFISYPLENKLTAYTRGLDEVQEKSLYAALLCSKHYCSFFSGSITEKTEVQEFLEQEQKRQQEICESVEINAKQLAEDFKLLQFCDDLSLYVCMNNPGITKSEEVSWFKNGFPQSFSFAPNGIQAKWVDDKQVSLDPFPFVEPLTISFSVYSLPMSLLEEQDEQIQLDQLQKKTQTVTFISS